MDVTPKPKRARKAYEVSSVWEGEERHQPRELGIQARARQDVRRMSELDHRTQLQPVATQHQLKHPYELQSSTPARDVRGG